MGQRITVRPIYFIFEPTGEQSKNDNHKKGQGTSKRDTARQRATGQSLVKARQNKPYIPTRPKR